MTTRQLLPPSLAEAELSFARYPSVLLGVLFRLRNTEAANLGGIEKLLLDAAEAVIKYLAVVMIAQYRLDLLELQRVETLIAKLCRPSLGTYSALLRELIRLYRQSQDPLLTGLRDFYDDDVGDETFVHVRALARLTDHTLPRNARSYKHLLDAVVHFRNKGAAHGATAEEAESREQRIPALAGVIAALVERLRFVGELELIEIHSTRTEGSVPIAGLWIHNGQAPTKAWRSAEPDLPHGHPMLVVPLPGGQTRHLDLFPFCIAQGEGMAREVLFLGEFRKNKAEYLSYASGSRVVLDKDDAASATLAAALDGIATEGRPGLPAHMRHLLDVSSRAQRIFSQAQVLDRDGDTDASLDMLRMAISDSPGFSTAVSQLALGLYERGEVEQAHGVLDEYLDLRPDDPDALLLDARVLLELKWFAKAEARLGDLERASPDHPELVLLRADAQREEQEPCLKATGTQPEFVLPQELLVEALVGSRRRAYWILGAVGIIGSASIAVLFSALGDLVMALTIASMGLLWTATHWATFRFRRILNESRSNFASFLRPSRGKDPADVYDSLLLEAFGTQVHSPARLRDLWGSMGQRPVRSIGVSVLAIAVAGLALDNTKYAPFGLAIDLLYAAYVYLVALSTAHLVACQLSFQGMLGKLTGQRVHFSLVQHPKHSIRYLSYLSRRLSYPLLLIFVLATATLYLGPFLANLRFVAAMASMVLLVCWSYYRTIFLVRSVITREKWRIISVFSVHFHVPFERLVERADRSDLQQIKHLLEIRDFFDSMDVWAERRSVLVGTSLFFVGVLFLTPIGISNLMTRKVMPDISQAANTHNAGRRELTLTGAAPASSVASTEVKIKGVDDTVMVCWAPTLTDLLDRALYPQKDSPTMVPALGSAGCARCDWAQANHGQLSLSVPQGDQLHLLLLAYNRIYRGYFWMGGGKVSYDIMVRTGGRSLLNTVRFIRTNTWALEYVAYIQATQREEDLIVEVHESGGENPLAGHGSAALQQHVHWLAGQLRGEGSVDSGIFTSHETEQEASR